MIRKTDRRTVRTRAALLTAFRELTLTRGYESVAVGDIIRRAGVGRSTFYLHFPNKQTLLRHSLEFPCARLLACLDSDVPPESLVPLLEHFREQRALNRVFFEEPIRSIWIRRLAAMIERQLPRQAAGVASLPRGLRALMIAEMQIGLVTHWVRGSGSARPESIAHALSESTQVLLASTHALIPR